MNKIGVLTSGGDSPGMNAAVRAVVRCGIEEGLEVYGIQRGFEGLIDGDIELMERRSVGDILQRGGTILKTARSERFMSPEGQEQAASMLRTFGIEGLVVIGGDGSMHGAAELARQGVTVMVLPGTIDNDMGYTEYTIGFDTAVNTVLDAITKIRDTSSAHERTTVIEVMGRRCGDIALYAGLAGGAEMILVPEIKPDIMDICKKVVEGRNRGKQHSIIICAEGADISSSQLTSAIEKNTGRETRLVVLSYLQRGGSPTLVDRRLATLSGAKAAKLLGEDSTSKAIGVVNGEIIAWDLEDALSQTREFDREMYELIEVLAK